MDNLRDSTMPVRYGSTVKLLDSCTFKLKPNNCNDLYELIIEIDESNICLTAKRKKHYLLIFSKKHMILIQY